MILCRDPCLNLARDVLGHVSFEREYVAQVAVVGVGPKVFVGWPVNKLRSDPHAIARALDRALGGRVRAELLAMPLCARGAGRAA